MVATFPIFSAAAGYVDRILKGEKPADPSGADADQVRAGDQPKDRKGAWFYDPGIVSGSRRRGDRMILLQCVN
jgi:hypothetical protein